MWDLVGNPEDRFSQNEAQIIPYLDLYLSSESMAFTRCSCALSLVMLNMQEYGPLRLRIHKMIDMIYNNQDVL